MIVMGLNCPGASHVVAEEAARFRSASPADRMRAIRSVLSAGALLIERSPRRDFLEACQREQEAAGREAIKRFLSRHAQHT